MKKIVDSTTLLFEHSGKTILIGIFKKQGLNTYNKLLSNWKRRISKDLGIKYSDVRFEKHRGQKKLRRCDFLIYENFLAYWRKRHE